VSGSLAAKRAWKKRNPEKRRAENQAYKKAHPEKNRAAVAAWKKAHPEWARAASRKHTGIRTARKIGAFVESVDHDAVFVRDGGVCQICDSFVGIALWHIDHRIPLSRGGQHSYANCQLAHATCNLRKGVK
jgi:5-methylcytosine-specific restriction endonuclease McrA